MIALSCMNWIFASARKLIISIDSVYLLFQTCIFCYWCLFALSFEAQMCLLDICADMVVFKARQDKNYRLISGQIPSNQSYKRQKISKYFCRWINWLIENKSQGVMLR